MINFKNAKAALRSLVFPKLSDTQARGGSINGHSRALNYNSINTMSPARLATAFAAADRGNIVEQAEFFELIENDAHIFAELNKRRQAVAGLPWHLQPPRDATQSELDRVDELTDILLAIDKIEDVQFDVTDAIGKGFVALEINWQAGETYLPKSLTFVPQRFFTVNIDTNQLEYMNCGIAEPLWSNKWLIQEHRAKSGYIGQTALFRVLAWTYAYKHYNIKDMQRFLELYGLPLRLGKFPAGTTEESRSQLLRAVRNIGNDGAGIVPSAMAIDFIDVQKGSVADFISAIEYWERKQSLAILGGTLTSQADGKSSTNALGNVHNAVRAEILLHDIKQLEPAYTKGLLEPISLINGMFEKGRTPLFKYDAKESVDRQVLIDVFTKAVNAGMQIDIDKAHEMLQIPRGNDINNILTVGAQKTALTAVLSKKPSETIAENLTVHLTDLAAAHEKKRVSEIAKIVAEAGDFESALEQISKLTLKPAGSAQVDLIAQGMMAANLAGRVESQ